MVLIGNPISTFSIFAVVPVTLTARSPSFLSFTYISHAILPAVRNTTPCKRYLFTLFNHCFNFLHHYCSFRFHVVIMDDSEEANYHNSIQRSCHAGKLKKDHVYSEAFVFCNLSAVGTINFYEMPKGQGRVDVARAGTINPEVYGPSKKHDLDSGSCFIDSPMDRSSTFRLVNVYMTRAT